MGDSVLVLFLTHSLLFSFIFWILTFLGKKFYQDRNTTFKLNFYECGFKTLGSARVSISIQFFLVCLFLIIYDSEFLTLYPAAFNFFFMSSVDMFVFTLFLIFMLLALIVDYIYSALDWTL